MRDQLQLESLEDLDVFIDSLVRLTIVKKLPPTVVNSISRLLTIKLKLYELKDLEERISRLEKLVEKTSRR